MGEKYRTTMYLDRAMMERLQAVLKEAGGFTSASQLVNDLLANMVPTLEELVAQAKSGDREAMLRFADAFMAGNLATLGTQAAALRNELLREPEEEAPD